MSPNRLRLQANFFWWEIVEQLKKLVLVGFATVILPDTMYQLLLAFMFCLLHMLFSVVCQPYRALGNDHFALSCNFSLTVVFFFAIFLKFELLTEAVSEVMTQSLKDRFEMQETKST